MKYVIRKVPERDTKYLENLLPNALVFCDHEKKGTRWSFLEAIKLADDDAVYVQDDMVLCEDFMMRAEKYIQSHKDVVIVFSYQDVAKIYNDGFYHPSQGSWLLCTYIPKQIANQFLMEKQEGIFHEKAWNVRFDFDDIEFSEWLASKGYKVFCTHPCLAGHQRNKSATKFSRSYRICSEFPYQYAEAGYDEDKRKWGYEELDYSYDMSTPTKIGTGTLMVHDIFDETPNFMRNADLILTDPPYNQSALTLFYTMAQIDGRQGFDDFAERFLEVISDINPKTVCLQSGVPQTNMWLNGLQKAYPYTIVKESYYYNKKTNKCNFIIASKAEIPDALKDIPYTGEEKIISYICKNADFKCVADPCMGQGLVAFYANKYGKEFAGTEINPKRLAVCANRVLKGKKK